MAKIIKCKKCGQIKLHHAKGLCNTCYNKPFSKSYWKKNKDEQNRKRREKFKNNPELRKHRSKMHKLWREKNKEHRKTYMIQWNKNNKNWKQNYNKQYRIDHPDLNKKRKQYFKEYNMNHYEESRVKQSKFRKTEKGKINDIRCKTKRKRKLGFNLIIPNIIDEPIDYHHIDNENVIPLPRDIHRHFYRHNVKEHREALEPIIEQLYEMKF